MASNESMGTNKRCRRAGRGDAVPWQAREAAERARGDAVLVRAALDAVVVALHQVREDGVAAGLYAQRVPELAVREVLGGHLHRMHVERFRSVVLGEKQVVHGAHGLVAEITTYSKSIKIKLTPAVALRLQAFLGSFDDASASAA